MGRGDGCGDAETAHARGTALARSREPGLQIQILWRFAVARRSLSSGNGLGVADRPLYRRMAEGASGRGVASPQIRRRLHSAHERGLYRLDQRDLRCRGAIHTPRLCRAGVERSRGTALLGQDGAARAVSRGAKAFFAASTLLSTLFRPVPSLLQVERRSERLREFGQRQISIAGLLYGELPFPDAGIDMQKDLRFPLPVSEDEFQRSPIARWSCVKRADGCL